MMIVRADHSRGGLRRSCLHSSSCTYLVNQGLDLRQLNLNATLADLWIEVVTSGYR